MPEPLKNVYDKVFVKDLAIRVTRFDAHFDSASFMRRVFVSEWQNLELKARMSHLSDVLHDCLSGQLRTNFKILSEVAKSYREDGRSGFEYMFLPDYVEKHGQHTFSSSMKALAKMTETGSAEFAVRPFIVNDQTKSLAQLMSWSQHKNEHLRRLASEGCRPRLPWAMALPEFKRDPTPILPILEQLKDDPSLYVRRSVANNLNDISKDHPELVIALARDWLGRSEDTDWLVKHACRGLLKSGIKDALLLFGFAAPENLTLRDFTLDTDQVTFGDALSFRFVLQSQEAIGKLRLEYAIDFVKANGSTSRKVFKISEADVGDNQIQAQKSHKFLPISTRVHYPGMHQLSIIVNGEALSTQPFELLIP